jgi:hypothetical protein
MLQLPWSAKARRTVGVLAALGLGAWTSSTGGTTQAAGQSAPVTPISERIAEARERMSRAVSISAFQVDAWFPGCKSWMFPKARVIDCRLIGQEAQAPSQGWRDSVVALLLAPGAILPARDDLGGVCHDDIGLRFTSGPETTTVWIGSGCSRMAILTPTSATWARLGPVSALRSLIDPIFPAREHEDPTEVEYYDTPPQRTEIPTPPPGLFVGGSARADTVLLNVLVGKDGRVAMVTVVHSVSGSDSLAATWVGEYGFRPALSAGRPVKAWIRIAVPVGSRGR